MSEAKRSLLAGIDAGGTTFKCAVADTGGQVLARRRIPVSAPGETIAACILFFREVERALNGSVEALGLATFGPVDVDPDSRHYGTILNTPKPGWANVNLRLAFSIELDAVVAVETDVNGALAAELAIGAAQGVRRAAYVTVGTGIGAGLWSDGIFLGAPLHPELGHIPVRRHEADHDFAGVCPFHGDCLEGLASAPALAERADDPAGLPHHHPLFNLEAYYIAQACLTLTLTFRPERILLGGGVMLAEGLVGKVRSAFAGMLGSYLGDAKALAEAVIHRPALGDDAGLHGGLILARKALERVKGIEPSS